MTIKQGDVFEHTKQDTKRRYIYCGKIRQNNFTKFLLYQYNDYGATAQYIVVDTDWIQSKRGEIEFLDEFPYSARDYKKKFIEKYKTDRRGRRY